VTEFARAVGEWLDALPRGMDPDAMPGWMRRGREFGPGVVPVLEALWAAPQPARRTKAVRAALYQLDRQSEARYFPHDWCAYQSSTTPAKAKQVPPDTGCLTLAPPPTTQDLSNFATPLAALPELVAVRIESGAPQSLDFLTGTRALESLELPKFRTRLDLAALGALRSLRHLRIGEAKHVATEAVGAAVGLRSLAWEGPPAELDMLAPLDALTYLRLERFAGTELGAAGDRPALETLRLESGSRLTTLDSLGAAKASLRDVSVGFSAKLDDASALAGAGRLERLTLRQLPSLRDVGWLPRLPGLRALSLVKCSRLTDVAVVGELTTLTHLTLVDMPALPSLDFLTGLRDLRHLDLAGTRIADGSYAPLHGLPHLLTVDGWMLKGDEIPALRRALPQVVFNGLEAYARDPAGAPG